MRSSLGVDYGILLLTVARLVPVKGIDTLLAALEGLDPAIRLIIAGDGPQRQRLEHRARVLGQRVRFEGTVDATRRDTLLSTADLFVLPSRPLSDGRTEGAPVALLEAMGAGLAVVARESALASLIQLPMGV